MFHPIPNAPGWNRLAGFDNGWQKASFYGFLSLQHPRWLLPENPANTGDQTEHSGHCGGKLRKRS
jgi:hypothetical protein